MSAIANNLRSRWSAIRSVLLIRNEREYDAAVKRLHALLDEVGDNERHPLFGLVDTLGTLTSAYEERRHPIPDCRGSDVLQALMEEHGLSQSDLPEIGSQGVLSEILRGKRELNVRQMRLLAKRFHVSPAVFIEVRGPGRRAIGPR